MANFRCRGQEMLQFLAALKDFDRLSSEGIDWVHGRLLITYVS